MPWLRMGEKPHHCKTPGPWERMCAGCEIGAKWQCGYPADPSNDHRAGFSRGCGQVWVWKGGYDGPGWYKFTTPSNPDIDARL